MASDIGTVLIDSVFIATLIERNLYAEPVKGLAETLKARVPNGLTEETLLEAAETVIRTHGSGAFPKMPECLRVIEEAHRRRGSLPAKVAAGGVTRETYPDRAASFARMSKPVVISADNDATAWAEWASYFAALGMTFSADQMRERRSTSWTVPTTYPQHFDPSWTPETQIAPRARRSDLDHEARGFIAETTRQCVALGIDPKDFAARRPVLTALLEARRPPDREVSIPMHGAA